MVASQDSCGSGAGLSAPDAGVGRKQGDVAAGLAKAAKRIDAEYQTPFLAHATMEPQNCTAHVIGDKAEIWASTQDAERSMKFAAQALGIALDNIVLHPTLKDGRVEQSNFHDYPMVRLAEAPKVESIIMPSGGFWGGAGEPPPALVAPALCNAIFAATGKRIRDLPLKNHDLRGA
jgi:CO/xanthine dehydrogenase Mo-binding subunit